MRGEKWLDLRAVTPLDEKAMQRSRARWNAVAKPLKSLGRFEDLIAQIAGIQGTEDVRLTQKCCVVFCGDHGVVEEGVSQSDQSVTTRIAHAVANGTSNVNLMAQSAGIRVFAVDMGMHDPVCGVPILDKRLGRGTENFTKGPAMSPEKAQRALQEGSAIVGQLSTQGYTAIALGEMGIGNTTSVAAIMSALLAMDPNEATGRGAGLSEEGLARKIRAVRRAIEVNHPDPADPYDVLSKLGGFEIAAMAGACLGGAVSHVPIILDGIISLAAALLAVRMCPMARNYLVPSHFGGDPAAKHLLDALEWKPVIHADMALGEGTGAVMLLSLLDMALAVYNGTHTFDSLGMEAYQPQGGQR